MRAPGATSFEGVLGLFAILPDAEQVRARLQGEHKTAVVLTHCERWAYKTQRVLMPLAFLLRTREDLVLLQVVEKRVEPRIEVVKDGKIVLTVEKPSHGTWEEPISAFIAHIGRSKDCEDDHSLQRFYRPIDYSDVLTELDAYTASQRDCIANAANVSAILWEAFNAADRPVNWVGFYFARPLASPTETQTDVLILGPFQGKKACHTIPFDRGVCGAAASTKVAQRIADVHTFEGHIACDNGSQSELVVPVCTRQGELVAVLDLDCPETHGFTAEDERQLVHLAALLAERSDWSLLRAAPFPSSA